MRAKLIIVVFVMALGVALAPGAAAQEATTGHATLHPVNQSGVNGSVDFTEAEGSVQVTGMATGLQPSSGRYVSLVYDRGSVSGGPEACEPTTPDDPGLVGMFVGTWVVDESGSGTLVQPNPLVASLEEVDTVSIRDTTINDGMGPEAVVACGQIAVLGGR